MHVFVAGGSGLTGPAVVAEPIAAGRAVVGLARSDDAAGHLLEDMETGDYFSPQAA